MGLLNSLFGGDKSNSKSVDKLVLRVKERYAQPEYRREAMDKLLSMGTPEAYAGVLTRFTVVAQSPHWDEEEKRWLADELATRGEPARAALKAFLAKEDHVAFASKSLSKLSASKQAWLSDMLTALAARPPEDHRTTIGKAEIINQLKDGGDGTVVTAVVPYFNDHADDVQLAAFDCAEHHAAEADDDSRAALTAALKEVVVDDGRSARVLRNVGGVLSRMKVAVDPTKPLPAAVAEDFEVKDGLLVSLR